MAEILNEQNKLDPNQFPDQTITIVVKHKGKVFAKGMQLFLGTGAEVDQALINLEHVTALVHNHILYKLARDIAPLRLDQLEKMPPHKIFGAGTFMDSAEDVNISDTKEEMRWAAKRGEVTDWAVYVGPMTWSIEEILKEGTKVTNLDNVRTLVPSTDEVLEKYRR